MIKNSWLLLVAFAFAAGCATQEPPKPAPPPAPPPAPAPEVKPAPPPSEPNRGYTEGKGEKQPVTGDKCKKMGREHRSNKKLVTCLAPDRRVEIEVIGTRQP